MKTEKYEQLLNIYEIRSIFAFFRKNNN